MTTEAQVAGQEDSRYAEGMAHLQLGQWPEAIACFEGLLRRDPGNAAARRALDEAQFKAGLDARTTVKAKRWILPARPLIVRLVLLAVILVAVLVVGSVIRSRLAPQVARLLEQRKISRLEQKCSTLTGDWKLDEAEACYQELLAAEEGHTGAVQGLEQVSDRRETQALYLEAIAFQEAGDYAAAVERLTQVKAREPRYPGDVEQRLVELERGQKLDELYAQAVVAGQEGRPEDALSLYEELYALDVAYRRDTVHQALYSLHMELGKALIDREPPAAERVPQALDHFRAALALEPRDTAATQERDLAQLFVSGQARFQGRQWEEAVSTLRALSDQRPDYLRGLVSDMLYQAYLGSGDQLWAAGQCSTAYARYQAACALPVADKAVCRAGLSKAQPCLTPTPTASITPTPTPEPTSTPRPEPTLHPALLPATPTPTALPLSQFHGKIVFTSESEEQPGLWIMDPDGKNRRYLGSPRAYKEQYDALREAEALSPDGESRAYTSVGPSARTPQIFIQDPPHPQYGQLPPRQITFHTGLSYDPVWSPDGGRIAYVSQENLSDDIWVVNVDGSENHWIVRNTWEWDKHPSWSPDSQRLVFWSNRDLHKQIWVMEADGRNPINISNNQWDEYDPIWIK